MTRYAHAEEAEWSPINDNNATSQQSRPVEATYTPPVAADNPLVETVYHDEAEMPKIENLIVIAPSEMHIEAQDVLLAKIAKLEGENERYRAYVVRNNDEKKQLIKDIVTLTSFLAVASAAISQLLVNEHLVEAQAYFKPILARLKRIDANNLMGSYKEIFAVVKMIKVDEIKDLTEKIHRGFDTSMFTDLPFNSVIDICDRYKINVDGFHDLKNFYAKSEENTEGVQRELPPNFQNTLI